jgi:hypothetical protein
VIVDRFGKQAINQAYTALINGSGQSLRLRHRIGRTKILRHHEKSPVTTVDRLALVRARIARGCAV